jgi:pimeloyl-ACP methyl ester carboxylesterase
MLYALNLFNLISGKEDQYRRYSIAAGKMIYAVGGRVVAAGHAPLRFLHGDIERRHMIVVEFPNETAFERFLEHAERDELHALREGATADYIWTLFNHWDMREWVRAGKAAPEATGANDSLSETQPALILLPGLLCDAALWQPQIEALSAYCKPWVAQLTQDESIEAMAARVLREAPAENFAVAGLSMGGYVAIELVRQAPHRVTRLALLDTRARLDTPEETARRLELVRLAETERGFTPITNRMLPLLIHSDRLQDQALIAMVRGMAGRTGVEAYVGQQHAIMSRPDARETLRQCQCPTLVLCGREDLITPLEMSMEMVVLLPDAQLSVIEDCGHLSTLEKPREVNTALSGWLEVPSR